MKITIAGSHGVGKTTFAKTLAKKLKINYIHDIVREEAVKKGFTINEKTSLIQRINIFNTSLTETSSIVSEIMVLQDGTRLLQLRSVRAYLETLQRNETLQKQVNQNLAMLSNAREKVASDGRTQLAIFRDGIFDMVTSGAAITKGNPLGAVTSGTDINKVFIADATASGANIIGTALEDAAAGETIEVHVRI